MNVIKSETKGDILTEKLSDGTLRSTNTKTKEVIRKNKVHKFVAHSKNGALITDHKKTGLRYYRDNHGVVKTVNLILGTEERGKMNEMYKSGTELVTS